MKGARDVCNGLLINASNLCIGFRRFYLMYFVAHEVMGHTAWHGDVLFDTATWFAEDDEEEVRQDSDQGKSCSELNRTRSILSWDALEV